MNLQVILCASRRIKPPIVIKTILSLGLFTSIFTLMGYSMSLTTLANANLDGFVSTSTPLQPNVTLTPSLNAPKVSGVLPPSFEIGAYINDYDPENFVLMQSAGMNWVKIQLRYDRGDNADDYQKQIQLNHENGFKILFGVVGLPEELIKEGYFEAYSVFVARLAELGVDGIEVWNEVNIDRDWATGQIDPVMYTNFLRVAYTAIKNKNPDTLVISAGLAPTGFFEGCMEIGCDDDTYYQGMADAGAAQYMDCVGVHYNEGIISPIFNSDDPRDDFPTRYLERNTARAYDPFGGAVPVCYTALGYLTPESFPPLPGHYGWAQNVTIAEQASWLGSAALLNAQSGKVRLMIIWNLDFEQYDNDPAAGYAILRPDGSCPACDTLGSLRTESN